MITRDSDVRAALMKNVISDHIANPDTLVVEELGLNRGSCRVDVAVVNGLLHGYEIKSDADTLSRLPSQVISYSAVLDKATLVVGASHTMRALSLIPDWWGVRIVKTGARGAVLIEPLRNNGVRLTYSVGGVRFAWPMSGPDAGRITGQVLRYPHVLHRKHHLFAHCE
ncbi:sce7726 family protein [Xanthomonas campestris]|uniref:sce7726 family protein n=1 Tax=Xanthomonas campestris TaxID=339 RepID=UPI0011C0537E|nr:sce7726 family protein [Xanthomonas campestris]MEA9844115.1 sce7726 family protein [Xanthomonas campestris pv. raphani]MEA9905741.1 sce7726 family protein [Xanthomonas campestris pv. raphani]